MKQLNLWQAVVLYLLPTENDPAAPRHGHGVEAGAECHNLDTVSTSLLSVLESIRIFDRSACKTPSTTYMLCVRRTRASAAVQRMCFMAGSLG